jgi:hypothetical protein
LTVVAEGIVPFFIDWGSSPHPAASAARGCTLRELRAEHPDVDGVRKALDAVGLPLRVAAAPKAQLIAVIDSPRGRVELR